MTWTLEVMMFEKLYGPLIDWAWDMWIEWQEFWERYHV
jgi:hypothetical protein